MLDAASNGHFLGRSEDEGLQLIENLAQSDSIYNEDFDRGNRGGGGENANTRKELKSLQDKIDLLLSERSQQRHVKFVGEHEDIAEDEGVEEELCYMNNNGTWYKKEPSYNYPQKDQTTYPNQYQPKPPFQISYQTRPLYNNQQGGYQNKQSHPPGFYNKQSSFNQGQARNSFQPQKDNSTDALLKQLLESQARNDRNYNDMSNRLKALEGQFASMSSNSKRPMGSLPGKPETNPKGYCNAVYSEEEGLIEEARAMTEE